MWLVLVDDTKLKGLRTRMGQLIALGAVPLEPILAHHNGKVSDEPLQRNGCSTGGGGKGTDYEGPASQRSSKVRVG